MSEKVAIKKQTLEDIGNAIRAKDGTTELIPVTELASKIGDLSVGSNKLPQVIDGTVTEITAEDLKGVTILRNYAFYYCSSLTSVTIGNSVTSIGNYAFYYCSYLTSVTIGNSVTSIGEGAFHSCSRLTSVIFAENSKLTSIGRSAFNGCRNITSINIPKGVMSIGDNAFVSCAALTSITIPDSVTSIGSSALSSGKTITFLGMTPPTIQTSTFTTGKLEKIIVPKGCGEIYKSATNWSNFADYIEVAAE